MNLKCHVSTNLELNIFLYCSSNASWVPDRNGVLYSSVNFFNGFANISTSSVSWSSSGSLTIAAWVNVQGYVSGSRLIECGTQGSNEIILTLSWGPGSNQIWGWIVYNGGLSFSVNNPAALSLGYWEHIAVTQTSSQATLYNSGTQTATYANPMQPSIAAGYGSCYIGKDFWGNGNINAFVDDLAFFNRALSAAEISTVMYYTTTTTTSVSECCADFTGLGVIFWWVQSFWTFDANIYDQKMNQTLAMNNGTSYVPDRNGWSMSAVYLASAGYAQINPTVVNLLMAPAGVGDNNQFTLAAWVNLQSYVMNAKMFDCGTKATSEAAWTLNYGASNGPVAFQTWTGGYNTFLKATTLPLGIWQHIAVGYMWSPNNLTMYTNGLISASINVAYAPNNLSDCNCYLGKSLWGDGNADVYVDDLVFLNMYLSSVYIQTLMGFSTTAVTIVSNFSTVLPPGWSLYSYRTIQIMTD